MEEELHSELDLEQVAFSGQNVFAVVEGRVRSLLEGEKLVLLVPFEPKPLFRYITGWGASFEVEKIGGRFRIVIERSPVETLVPRLLDLRREAPPDPVARVMEAYDALARGGCLIVHLATCSRELLDRLDSQAIAREEYVQADGSCQIYLLKEL